MVKPAGDKWITCDEYTLGPFTTAEQAEGKLAEITRSGRCDLEHTVTEARVKPEPKWKR